ncbi:hypothetical protein QBC39DRAFT_419077 [Podospora conica]|nr:hypothetical protein QBC39DRAFT_419077 [Schizothecium conicum]
MARKKPAWILKAPRVVLVLLFPITNFILFLLLTIGCISPSLTAISPVLITSTTPLSIGGLPPALLDIRIGFVSICFGPPPYACLRTVPPPPSNLAPNALRTLALALQSVLIPNSLLPPLRSPVLLSLSLLTNLISIYFNILTSRAAHIRSSIFARALDWAAAAATALSFASFQSSIPATERLIRVATGASGLLIRGGSTAGGMFAATVGVSVAGAVINTVLTAGDAGGYARRAEDGGEEDDGGLLTSLEVEGEKFRGDMQRRRAAYSVMYT